MIIQIDFWLQNLNLSTISLFWKARHLLPPFQHTAFWHRIWVANPIWSWILLDRQSANLLPLGGNNEDQWQRLLAQLSERLMYRIAALIQVVVSAQKSIDLTSPLNVLSRGYSVTRDVNGRAITSVTEVTPGQLLSTLVTDGNISSTIN